MGFMDEESLVLLKNLYVIVGFWLAIRFLDHGLNSPKTVGGFIICFYSALITTSYGSFTEIGNPNFYVDWIITVPLIFYVLSTLPYQWSNQDNLQENGIYGALTGSEVRRSLLLIGVTFFFIAFILSPYGHQADSDLAGNGPLSLILLGLSAFFIGGIMVIILSPNSIREMPLTVGVLVLLLLYPLLFFLSTSEFPGHFAGDWTGFNRDYFEGSYLSNAGLNWFDLIGILYLLSFICKFWLSKHHVPEMSLFGDITKPRVRYVATSLLLFIGIISAVLNFLIQ